MRVALVAACLAGALVVAGCGADQTPTGQVPAPASSAAMASSSPAAPGRTLPMPSGAAVQLDPALLSVLPGSVGGVPVSQEPESFAEALKDPAFVASVDRAVFAIAVSGGDLTSGVVAHLRQGVYSDAMFGDWRATYDEGACAQAGGVVARAQETFAGRTTYVTTCGGGLRVYHTYVASRGVIVSLFSTGTQDFGAQLMGGIQG